MLQLQNFDALIFDLGGVILDIDYRATEKALLQLLGENFNLYHHQRQAALFDDLETGRVSAEQFFTSLQAAVGFSMDRQAFDKAWCKMLGALPVSRIQLLQKLAASKRLFLLSNTNAIHKAALDPIFAEAMGGESFDQLFERAYYSHEMGLRKPQPEIYQSLIDKHKLVPARTLFIDDLVNNIEGARRVGLQTLHLKGELLALELWQT